MASAGDGVAQVSAQLECLSKQLKAQKRKSTNRGSGINRNVRCHATLKIACVILALTVPRTDVALEFLKYKRRNKQDAGDWTEARIADEFNKFTPQEKEQMVDPKNKAWSKHLTSAKGWLRDTSLRDWVLNQNKDKGVAPVNDDVWKQKKAMGSKENTGALRPEQCPRWKRRQINQWILRWARRSRVLRGAFKDGERLPLETLQAKV